MSSAFRSCESLIPAPPPFLNPEPYISPVTPLSPIGSRLANGSP